MNIKDNVSCLTANVTKPGEKFREIKDNSDVARLMTVFTDSNAYDYEVCPKTSERKNYLKNTERGITEMCAIMDEIRNEGRNEGRIEGRNEGRNEGRIEGKMQGAIKMARTMLEKKLPEDVILSTLQESLGLSDTEAKALFEKEVACLV